MLYCRGIILGIVNTLCRRRTRFICARRIYYTLLLIPPYIDVYRLRRAQIYGKPGAHPFHCTYIIYFLTLFL